MKSTLTSIAACSLLAMLAFAQSPYPVRQTERQGHHLHDLGPVGPLPGQPYLIANTGLAAGTAVAPDGAMHAVLWYRDKKMDIGHADSEVRTGKRSASTTEFDS